MKETLFIFMVILCFIMGVTLFMFFCYHLSMVAKNVTTNEKIKKGDFMEF
jgi:palmitoyltransferase ZDHHC4